MMYICFFFKSGISGDIYQNCNSQIRLYAFIKTVWHIVLFVLQLLKKMGTSQQFSLRWNNYLRHITCAFDSLRSDEDLVDVTLSCEGKRIRAHKMLLSACSTYFRDLFKVSV